MRRVGRVGLVGSVGPVGVNGLGWWNRGTQVAGRVERVGLVESVRFF